MPIWNFKGYIETSKQKLPSTIQHVILKQKHVDKEGNQTQLRQRKKKLPTI
jgi:hypothetical protein